MTNTFRKFKAEEQIELHCLDNIMLIFQTLYLFIHI